MDTSLLHFILETVNVQHVPYYYFKDKYALDLLCYALGSRPVKIGQLKKSRWGFLLRKQALQRITAKLSDQWLRQEQLVRYWPSDVCQYFLGLGQWGEYSKHRNDDWYQTSRPGVNLVLQLNFGVQHNHRYYQWVQPQKDYHPFENDGHPIAQKGHTLAWVRLDIDLNTGEALIEEIQNDWLRSVKETVGLSTTGLQSWCTGYDTKTTSNQLRLYYEQEVRQHEQVWDEAVLAAALWFIKCELGISRIYYHTFESGNIMKQLTYGKPPRSLYTKLPRRFGFELTSEAPTFLRQDKYLKKTFKKYKHLKWFVLYLQEYSFLLKMLCVNAMHGETASTTLVL